MSEKLVYETLQSLYDYLIKLVSGIESLVEDLRTQREEKVSRILPQIIEGLKWSIEVIDYSRNVLEKHNFVIEDEKIKDVFGELSEAVNNNDDVLLCDIFEYEILDILKQWKSGLEKIVLS